MDREGAQAIADRVSRNVPLSELSIKSSTDIGMDVDSCELICELICRSVSNDKNLRRLGIDVRELFEDNLGQCCGIAFVVVARTLRDRRQRLFGREPGTVRLARQLRTNVTVARLCLLRQLQLRTALSPWIGPFTGGRHR